MFITRMLKMCTTSRSEQSVHYFVGFGGWTEEETGKERETENP